MKKPKVDLTTIISFLRQRCERETYARNLELVEEYLKTIPETPPYLSSEIEVEEVLCRSVLVAARRMLETPGHEHLKFLDLVHNVHIELKEWRTLGQLYYGEVAESPEALESMIDKRLQRFEDIIRELVTNARHESESTTDGEDKHIIRQVVVIDKAVWSKVLGKLLQESKDEET